MRVVNDRIWLTGTFSLREQLGVKVAETASLARRAACVVLTRAAPGSGELQVYLVRRSERLVFLGGFYAFPGGTVDPIDRSIAISGVPAGAAADQCSAALRELLEECGVLGIPAAAGWDAARLSRLRTALLADGAAWERLLQAEGLSLDASALRPMGHWVTPPFMNAPFAAQYFLLPLPAGASPEVWPGELTEGVWLTPAAALRAYETSGLYIAYPVLETLRALVACKLDVQAAAEALEQRPGPGLEGGGEMLHGIHLLPLRSVTLPPATHTNCYVLGTSDMVVVDPGTPFDDEQRSLFGYLERLRSQGARLREVWITHHHEDHVAAATVLQQRLGVPVCAHPHAAARLHGQVRIDRFLQDDEQVHLSGPSGEDAHWQVLLTPGHAPGHLCFYDTRRGHLLTGDAILGMGTTLVAPRPEGSMGDYMATLRRLLGLRLGMLFPGHGPPVAAAVDKIHMYIQHRTAREASIIAAMTEPLHPAEIVRRVYTDVNPAAYPLAELNVRAHLEKLQDEGRVSQDATGQFFMGAG